MFQISFSIRRKSPEVLNFKRIKVCKLSETPAEELVSGECRHRVVIQTTDNNPSNFSDSGQLFVMAGYFSLETTLILSRNKGGRVVKGWGGILLVTGRCNFILPLFSSKFLKHCILGPLTDIYEVTKH